jgi:FAD/FMN-containing dehydrogenase
MKDEIFELLKTKIKGEVLIDENTLQKYSKDTSLFEVKPSAVVYPKNILDIENLVHFVNDNKYQNKWLSLTPRSGGTCMSGGAIGEGLILDFTKNLNNFDLDKNNKRAVVQPGVFFRDFEKKSIEADLEMPVYPASKDLAAFGGMISNNCGGEKTLMYGQMRNFVQKLKVVLSNGREYEFKKISVDEVLEKAKEDSFIGGIYKRTFELIDENYEKIQKAKPKTNKNSSGYALWDIYDKKENTFDLTHLFTGAQGTLGIISEAEIKLIPVKKYKKLVVIMLKSWDDLPVFVQKILPSKPTSLETFDSATMKLAMRFMPEIARKSEISLSKFVFSFWPEFLMGFKLMWFPKLIVLAEFEEENEYILNEKVFDIKNRLADTNTVWRIVEDEKDSEKYFVIRRESFSLLRKNVNDKQTAPFIDDFCILPDKLPEFLPEFLRILKKYKIKANIAGHAGEGNLHIIPLMNLNDERERIKIRPCSDELYDLIIKYDGSITAEHNDGLIRTPYVENMFGTDVYKLFQEIKNIFDPNNIFNPGKKVNGDKDFAFNHMKRGLE